MTHAATCYLGGYRGPSKCCHGKCRHRINCNCPAGERIDREYIEAQIRSLDAEREMWKERLRALPMVNAVVIASDDKTMPSSRKS